MFIYKSRRVYTDQEGYLLDLSLWEEEMVPLLAEREGIILTESHLKVVLLVRRFYEEYNISPTIRMLVKAMEKEYGEKKGSSKYLFKLFREGPASLATKLAGLPKPSKCL